MYRTTSSEDPAPTLEALLLRKLEEITADQGKILSWMHDVDHRLESLTKKLQEQVVPDMEAHHSRHHPEHHKHESTAGTVGGVESIKQWISFY